MINDIILELVKAAIVGGTGMIVKMYLDIRSLRGDLDSAFCKIRALEAKNGTGSPPCPEAPK